MNRFMGMMPSKEIKKEESYKDQSGNNIIIQSGEHGWTVIYADGGTNYRDEDDSTENNFKKAYDCAVSNLGELTLNTRKMVCEC